MEKTILVIAPHPDDDILGVGGTILDYLQRGHKVCVVYVTCGDASCPEYAQEEFTKKRFRETKAAIAKLGLEGKNVFLLPKMYEEDYGGNYPPPIATGGFYPLRLNERLLVHYLMRVIRIVKPNIIFIPHERESHPDHQIVARQSQNAIRFACGKWFREYREKVEQFSIEQVWAYEVDQPIEIGDLNWVRDISCFWDYKIAALKKHKTQNINGFKKRMKERADELTCLLSAKGSKKVKHIEAFKKVR